MQSLIPAKLLKESYSMKLELNLFETDCLLKAVQDYIMDLRHLEAYDRSENYMVMVTINKFLLDSVSLEICNNLPF